MPRTRAAVARLPLYSRRVARMICRSTSASGVPRAMEIEPGAGRAGAGADEQRAIAENVDFSRDALRKEEYPFQRRPAKAHAASPCFSRAVYPIAAGCNTQAMIDVVHRLTITERLEVVSHADSLRQLPQVQLLEFIP